MPITVYPAPHDATLWTTDTVDKLPARKSDVLLAKSCSQAHKECKRIIQSSFGTVGTHTIGGPRICPYSNGFVDAAIQAYNEHHHLVIRPEDMWLNILTQLNLYINANAEQLREIFVDHQGTEELEVIGDADFGVNSTMMADLVARKVRDPSLRAWMMPAFTTTTDEDKVVAYVVMMGALQQYFNYKMSLRCGIPSVKLLGEKSDWEEILTRLERLPTFGKQPSQWYHLLRPVLLNFIKSFKQPDSKEIKAFWQKIAHHQDGGSGPSYYSGWITAFCFWGGDGKSLYESGHGPFKEQLVLDGIAYHRIDTEDIPPGYASVPVLVANGANELHTLMVAGSVGMQINASKSDGGVGLDTVQAKSGWWILEK
ncbi:hypothetical protein MMC13_005928 [Lambiella insularis]|nr:hypothetical protein [Lambiella insularis]